MGFATIGATALLLAAAVYGGSIVAVADYDADAQTDAAAAALQERAARRDATAMTITDVQYNPGLDRVTIDVENEGGATLDAARMVVLLDGVVVPVDSASVEGRTSTVWAPLTTLELTATWTVSPGDIAVVTGDGVSTYWRN